MVSPDDPDFNIRIRREARKHKRKTVLLCFFSFILGFFALRYTVFVYEVVSFRIVSAYFSVCIFAGIAAIPPVVRTSALSESWKFALILVSILNGIAVSIYISVTVSWLHIFGFIAAYFLSIWVAPVSYMRGSLTPVDVVDLLDKMSETTDNAVHEAIVAEREAYTSEFRDFFDAAQLRNTVTGEAINNMSDFWEWKRMYDAAVQHNLNDTKR